jgi:hypothetical protein
MKDEQTSPQLQSRSYRLAALDPDFLLGDSMRGVRLLLEFSKADEMLRNAGVRSIGAEMMAQGLKPHSSIALAAEQDKP